MVTLSYKFLALLRGINVGGKNIISKNSLRQAFEDMGFTNVLTYIQSGNILFRSEDRNTEKHTKKIEEFLSERFSFQARAVVLSENQLKSIIKEAPEDWGKNDKFRHRILFTLASANPKDIVEQLNPLRKGIEIVTIGPMVIYSTVARAHLSKSVLRKLPKTPEYQQITVRNHNTVNKLNKLFEKI
jgi:uncharacterized protein (DUF1697 family)